MQSWSANVVGKRTKVRDLVFDSASASLPLIYMHIYKSFPDTASTTNITKTKAADFPSLLRAKRSLVQTVERSDLQNTSVAQVTCIECGRKEVFFKEMQLRGADEGSTIFYTCECGNKYML